MCQEVARCKQAKRVRTAAASPPPASSSATRASSWLWDRLPTTPVGEVTRVPSVYPGVLSGRGPHRQHTSGGQVRGVHHPAVDEQHVQELKHRVRLG